MFQASSKMANSDAEDDAILLSRSKKFVSRLCDEFFILHNDRDLTDFTLQTGGKAFECHRVLLAVNSPVLKGMLKSQMKEARQSHMTLDNIDPQVLESILKYMYSGEIRIPKDLLKETIEAADYLQMDELKEMCIERAVPLIQPSNVLSWSKFSEMMSLQEIHSRSIQVMAASLNKVKHEQEFLDLDLSELTSHLVKIKSNADADDLLSASLDWINAHPQARREAMKELLEMLPLEKCSLDGLYEEGLKHEALLDILSKVRILDSMHQIREHQYPRENRLSKRQQFMIAGGYFFDLSHKNNECWLLDPQSSQALSKYTTIPDEHIPLESKICKTPEGFVLTGGIGRTDCLLYKSQKNTWKKLANLLHPRHKHGSVVVKNLLFIFGGFVGGIVLNSVHYMDLTEGSWQVAPNIPVGVLNPEITYAENNIFLLDTYVNHKLFHMDISSKSWSLKSIMPDELKVDSMGARMIHVRDQLLITGGISGMLAWYTPATDTWARGAFSQFHHNRAAVIQHENTILVVGGQNQTKVESYNMDIGLWSECEWEMPKALVDLAIISLD